MRVRKRIERLLRGIEFPGENEDELRRAAEAPELADRIMERISAEAVGAGAVGEEPADAAALHRHRDELQRIASRREEEAGAVSGWPWLAALMGNLGLLLFFGLGGHPSALLILGGGEFYSTMVFLFLGISVSVSVAGAVLSCDLALLRRAATALGLGG